MEIAVAATFLAGSAAWWRLKVIGKAELYRRIERWARIRAVAHEAYDKAERDQRAAEVAR